jgi:hypothetical protein
LTESGQLRSRAFSADLITRTKPSGNDSGARLARPCLACRGQGLMRRISAGQRQRRRTLVPLHRPAEGLLSRVPPLLASAHGLRERRWLGLGRPSATTCLGHSGSRSPDGRFYGLKLVFTRASPWAVRPTPRAAPPRAPFALRSRAPRPPFCARFDTAAWLGADDVLQVSLRCWAFQRVLVSPVTVHDHGALPAARCPRTCT